MIECSQWSFDHDAHDAHDAHDTHDADSFEGDESGAVGRSNARTSMFDLGNKDGESNIDEDQKSFVMYMMIDLANESKMTMNIAVL